VSDDELLVLHPSVHSLIFALVDQLARCRCRTLPGEIALDGRGHPISSRWDHEETCPVALELAAFEDGPDDPEHGTGGTERT
jgi:hypothetical protein